VERKFARQASSRSLRRKAAAGMRNSIAAAGMICRIAHHAAAQIFSCEA
jgi:hypothetical protein